MVVMDMTNKYDKQLEGKTCTWSEENESTISNNTLRRFMLETQDILDTDLILAHGILDALAAPSDSSERDCDKSKPYGMVEHSEMLRNKADELNFVLNKIACMLGI